MCRQGQVHRSALNIIAIVNTGTMLIVRHQMELMKPNGGKIISTTTGTDMLIVHTLVFNNINVVNKNGCQISILR